MGRVPEFRRLGVEDFPKDVKSWLGKLLAPLNSMFKTIYENLNHGLTFEENMIAQVKTLTFTKLSTYPSSDSPLKFKNTMRVKPIGVIILAIKENVSNPSALTSAVAIDWSYGGEYVKINNITGLTNDTSYEITLLSIGG